MDREETLLLYVQDRLPDAERHAVDAQLATDPAMAAEVALLQAARAAFGAQQEPADHDAGWADLEARMDAQKPLAANENRPIRLSLLQVAAACAVSVVAWQMFAVPQIPTQPATYETVSQQTDEHLLQVIFQPDVTLAQTAAFLRAFDGSISDGPSAVGLYRLRFESAEQMQNALAAAQADTSLFEFAASQ